MSSFDAPEDARPEAGPLPKKRGEIGYVKDLQVDSRDSQSEANIDIVLPARHPADHEPGHSTVLLPPPPSAHLPPQSLGAGSITLNPTSPVPHTPSHTTPTGLTGSKQKGLLKLWDSRRVIRGGFQLKTFILFIAQLFTAITTITGWALSIHFLQGKVGNSGSTFVHIVFTVLVLGQLLLLERRLFRLRAERYMNHHSGDMTPSARFRRRLGSDPSFALSPWNRPPLPTYAAALAESGVGTGDVEDHILAAPPPPAYGNTRGSTLLLQGYLRESLRAQRPNSQDSSSSHVSRPVGGNEEFEAAEDAERARRLEDTLATLERSTVRR